MAQVFEISVERSRTAQVKDYEPSAAKVSVKASVEDGEDWREVTRGLLNGAREEVYNSLGLKLPAQSGQETATASSGSSGKSSTSGANKGKNSGSSGNKSKSSAKSESSAKSDTSENSDIPDDTDNSEPDNAKADASDNNDIPDDTDNSEAGGSDDAGEEITQQDLADLVTTSIQNNKITAPKVKKILNKYSVDRVRDLEESNYASFKQDLEAKLKD